jgi:hypothetical protein
MKKKKYNNKAPQSSSSSMPLARTCPELISSLPLDFSTVFAKLPSYENDAAFCLSE